MKYLFFISLGLLVYTFVWYPLMLFIVSRLFSKQTKKDSRLPSVTLIISAYNEERSIREKLENTLKLDYPKEQLEIIVVSDGSTDNTDTVVRSFEKRGVALMRIDGRKGKTHCQNRAVEKASGEILIFSDANSMYDSRAIRVLVSNFADPNVGVVCGELRYIKRSDTEETLYWKLEVLLKHWESSIDSCLGVNGAMYAIPKMLYVPLEDSMQSDFIEPFFVYRNGYRVIYEREAYCTEEAGSNASEFERKRRIMHGAFSSLSQISEFLNPFRYGWYSISLWSHKVLRWGVSVLLFSLFISTVFLANGCVLFAVLLGIQMSVYIGALLGRFFPRTIFSIPYYIVLVQIASFLAILDWISGKQSSAWESSRT